MSGAQEVPSVCDCDVCVYGKEVARVVELQPTEELKKFVDDLYWRYCNEMDDAGHQRGRWRDMRPLVHEIRTHHFVGGGLRRLPGHQGCVKCGILERNT